MGYIDVIVVQREWGLDTFQRGQRYRTCSENGSILKGKILLPVGGNRFCPLRVDLFSEWVGVQKYKQLKTTTTKKKKKKKKRKKRKEKKRRRHKAVCCLL